MTEWLIKVAITLLVLIATLQNIITYLVMIFKSGYANLIIDTELFSVVI